MTSPTRAEHKEDNAYCWVCRWEPWWYDGAQSYGPNWLETHEIARGPARKKAVNEPCAWLVLCNHCHRDVIPGWSIARQLALKKVRDFRYYDRVGVNRLRGRADEAITEEEVDRWVSVLQYHPDLVDNGESCEPDSQSA